MMTGPASESPGQSGSPSSVVTALPWGGLPACLSSSPPDSLSPIVKWSSSKRHRPAMMLLGVVVRLISQWWGGTTLTPTTCCSWKGLSSVSREKWWRLMEGVLETSVWSGRRGRPTIRVCRPCVRSVPVISVLWETDRSEDDLSAWTCLTQWCPVTESLSGRTQHLTDLYFLCKLPRHFYGSLNVEPIK